jgi:hypothetical protein
MICFMDWDYVRSRRLAVELRQGEQNYFDVLKFNELSLSVKNNCAYYFSSFGSEGIKPKAFSLPIFLPVLGRPVPCYEHVHVICCFITERGIYTFCAVSNDVVKANRILRRKMGLFL